MAEKALVWYTIDRYWQVFRQPKMKKKSLFKFLALLLFLLSFAPFSLARQGNFQEPTGVLRNIVVSKGQDKLEVTILISSYSSYNIFELHNPSRIALDLNDVYEIRARRIIEVNDFGLLRIRVGRFEYGVVRVVFDIQDKTPAYSAEKISNGLRLTFRLKEAPDQAEKPKEIKELKTEIIPEEKAEQKIEVKTKEEAGKKVEEVAEEKAPPPETAKGKETAEAAEKMKVEESSTEKIKEQLDETRKELDETKKKLEETVTLMNKMDEARLKQKKKIFRLTATGNYFSPTGGVLKDIYRAGIMVGVEFNVELADYIELWVSDSYFGKKAIDVPTGEQRKVKLIPLETGFRFRVKKNMFNPYFGIGGGYFQYREESPSGKVEEEQIGFIGQAGLIIKIGADFVFNLCVQFKHCPIETKTEKFDVGGFYLGGGIGIEF